MADETNPFVGMSFGRAVDKLRRDPSLAPKFDEVFKDEEDFNTLERARLHQSNSFYRGTIQGAATLDGLSAMVEQGPPKATPASTDPAEEARQQWADNLRGKFRVKGKRDNPQQVWQIQKDRYDAILDDLANYERMSDASGIAGYSAAIAGTLAGGIPTPENIVSWPMRGVSALGKMFWGGVQAGAINTAVDPVVQALNMKSDVQKDYDKIQTVLSFPIGFAIGGGLVGAGEVISKGLLKRNTSELTALDPAIISQRFEIGDTSITINGETTRVKDGQIAALKADETPIATPEELANKLSLEREALNTEEYNGVPNAKVAEKDSALAEAINNVTNAPPNFERLKETAEWAIENNRPDIAQQALNIVRAEAERPLSKPGVPEDSPKYKTIEENIKTRHQETQDNLAEMEKLVKGTDTVERQPGGLRAEPQPKTDYDRPPETVSSLQTMVSELEDAMGVPIRQGRLGIKTALGTFDTKTGVIHIKEYPDFSVASHEVGHAVESMFGKFNDPNNPLVQLRQRFASELRPLDYDQGPFTGQRSYEGYAEFIRYYLTNPAFALNKAPGFYSSFNNFLEQKRPDLLEKLIRFQQAYQNYLAATPEQITLAGIVTPKETWGDKVVAKLTDAKVAPTIRNVLALAYDAIINKDEDIMRVVRELGKRIKEAQGGKYVDIAPSDDPRIHFRRLQKASQTAMAQARDGIIPYGASGAQGPSITQALEHAVGKTWGTGNWNTEILEKFGAYLVARRGTHRWDKFRAGEMPNAPMTQSKEYLDEVIRLYDVEHPQFRQAAEMIHEFNRNLLQKMVDSGAFYKLDAHAMERIIADDPFYVPFMRDRSDKQSGVGGSGNNAGQGVFGMQGSMRDIINPIHTMMNNLMKVEQQIAHAEVMRSMSKLAQAAGTYGGKFIEMLPAHEVRKIEFDLRASLRRALEDTGQFGDNGARTTVDEFFQDIFGDDHVTGVTFKNVMIDGKREPVIFWNDAGEIQAARVIKKDEGFGLYEIMSTAPKPAADLMHEMTSFVSSTLTTAVTTHPFYALRNIFRDQFAATAFVPGYIPGYHAIKGLMHHIKDDEFAKAYRQFGGVNPAGGIVPAYADAVAADVNALAKQGFSIHKVFSMKGLSEAVTSLEMATRLGASEVLYRQKKKLGLSDYDAWLATINETADMLPFDRHGSHVARARTAIPFLNAYIQSMDKFNRVLGVPAKRALVEAFGGENGFIFKADSEEAYKAMHAWITLGISGFAMGAFWAAMFSGRSGYDDATGRTKAANFVMPVGDQNVFLMPKPWELAIGFTAGELAYRRLVENDERAGEQMRQAIYETFTSPNLIMGNPLVGTTLGALANYNFHTGTPIVSGEMAKRDAWSQFDEKSGAFSKKVGQITGWSPKKIDYMLSGYGGYWGQDLARLGAGNADDSLVGNLEDNTIARAGLRSAAQVSDAREKFWKHMGSSTGDFAKSLETYRFLNQSPQREAEAKAYFDTLPKDRKAWVTLHEAADENGKAVFKADDRRAHPLTRAADAVSVLSKMQKTVATNTAVDAEDKAALIVNPEIRKKVTQVLSTMAIAEMSNSLKIIGEPGYAGRPLVDMEVYMEQLKTLDPKIAQEVADRYATKKIYKTSEVAKVYKPMEVELVRAGGKADIELLTDDVVRNGYEFGADRKKQTPLRRTQIPGG
jgi:hypothetical protein